MIYSKITNGDTGEVEDEFLNTGECDLEGNSITVHNAQGFGGMDVYIECGHITWGQLDKLKAAIAEAEKRWRKKAGD